MVKYKKGDVLDSGANVIAHGVNTKGGFGRGIAGQIAHRWPNVRTMYCLKYNGFAGTFWKLGEVQLVHRMITPDDDQDMYIANCATQDDFGGDKVHADYDAIRTCMEKVKIFAKSNKYTIAMPKIGAGLANGDWKIIEKILEEVFNDYDVTVYTLED